MYSFDFQLKTGDKNVGTVYLPNETAINIPAIIYCHGWGGSRKLWTPTEKLREMALSNNIALVTFDSFGCGDTGGDYSQMTYRRWKENLSDITDFVSTQLFADKNRIGCYAFSSGSTAALRLAAEDERIAFIISIGTCISTHIFMNSGNSPAKLLAEKMESLLKGDIVNNFGIDFYRDTVGKAPIYSMKNIKCPVLFLQGTADNPYRIADAKMGYQIMNSSGLSANHIEIENGTHELDNVVSEAMNNVFDWLLPILRQ